MGFLGWMWDQIPVLGIIGRHNRQEEKKLKEMKKHTKELKDQSKELKKQTKELKKLQEDDKKPSLMNWGRRPLR